MNTKTLTKTMMITALFATGAALACISSPDQVKLKGASFDSSTITVSPVYGRGEDGSYSISVDDSTLTFNRAKKCWQLNDEQDCLVANDKIKVNIVDPKNSDNVTGRIITASDGTLTLESLAPNKKKLVVAVKSETIYCVTAPCPQPANITIQAWNGTQKIGSPYYHSTSMPVSKGFDAQPRSLEERRQARNPDPKFSRSEQDTSNDRRFAQPTTDFQVLKGSCGGITTGDYQPMGSGTGQDE